MFGALAYANLLIFFGADFFTSFGLLLAIREIANLPVRIPFMMMRHPIVYKLQNLFFIQALFVIIYTFFLMLITWLSPYDFHFELEVWLFFLVIYSIIVSSFPMYQIHTLMKNIKKSHLNIINLELQCAQNDLLNNKNSTATERLKKINNIISNVEAQREWPLSLKSAIIFLMTMTPVCVIVIASIFFNYK